MKQILIILGLFASVTTFAQSPRIKLNQITKDTIKGSVLISSPTDSGMVYSRDFYIAYGADTLLILYGDTIGGVGGGVNSIVVDPITLNGNGTTASPLSVDTATVISTIQGLVDSLLTKLDVDFSNVTGTLPIANGGTGSTTQNFVDLTTTQTISGAKTFTNTLTQSDGDANFDSGTLFVDESTNRVGIGTTSPSVKLQVDGQIIAGDVNSNDYDNTTTPGFHIGVVSTSSASRAMNLVHYGGTISSASALLRLRRSRGTSVGDYTKVEDGDYLGFLQWVYSNGTTWANGASIRAAMDGATGTGDFPTRLEFLTNADGTTTHAVKMTIKNDGGIEIPFLLNASTGNTMYYNTTTDEISYSSSSIRFKNDIEDLPIGLNELMMLKPTRYTYIPDGKKDYGFIAEQVYDVGLTEFVTFNQDNQIEGLKDKYFMILNTKAIQEQQVIIETQEQKITDLETTIQALITRIENLENK